MWLSLDALGIEAPDSATRTNTHTKSWGGLKNCAPSNSSRLDLCIPTVPENSYYLCRCAKEHQDHCPVKLIHRGLRKDFRSKPYFRLSYHLCPDSKIKLPLCGGKYRRIAVHTDTSITATWMYEREQKKKKSQPCGNIFHRFRPGSGVKVGIRFEPSQVGQECWEAFRSFSDSAQVVSVPTMFVAESQHGSARASIAKGQRFTPAAVPTKRPDQSATFPTASTT